MDCFDCNGLNLKRKKLRFRDDSEHYTFNESFRDSSCWVRCGSLSRWIRSRGSSLIVNGCFLSWLISAISFPFLDTTFKAIGFVNFFHSDWYEFFWLSFQSLQIFPLLSEFFRQTIFLSFQFVHISTGVEMNLHFNLMKLLYFFKERAFQIDNLLVDIKSFSHSLICLFEEEGIGFIEFSSDFIITHSWWNV